MPEDWLENYKAAEVPFNLVFDERIEVSSQQARRGALPRPITSSALESSAKVKEDPFGDGFEDFECYLAERPFGIAAEADSPRNINYPRIEAVLPGFPASLAGIKQEDVLVAVADCPVSAATWQIQAQLAELPARFQFRRRRHERA